MTVKIFFCYAHYAHKDKDIAVELREHLSGLENSQLISIWEYGNIKPGDEWEQEVKQHLEEAPIILLLISASFLGSKCYYRDEMRLAIERHERKDARVIPVLLRDVDWKIAPLDKLKALPDDEKPITGWKPQDKGYKNVALGIRKVIEQWNEHNLPDPIAERKAFMAIFNQLVEAVRLQMQPRAGAIANTLQQLSVFVPNDVTLADLIVGWRILSHASKQGEEPAVTQRRVTCGELANIASQLTTEQGNVAQAIKTWRVWADAEAFRNSNDPRHVAMVRTFARELTELQEAAH